MTETKSHDATQMTGAAMIVELTRQLQGRCGARQVPGAKVALAQVQGGSTPGIGVGASAVVMRPKIALTLVPVVVTVATATSAISATSRAYSSRS